MPRNCGGGEARIGEGREWWVQLQRQRGEFGIRRQRSVLADNCGNAPKLKTLQQLLEELRLPADVSPELAADLGLEVAGQEQPAAEAEAQAQVAAALAPGGQPSCDGERGGEDEGDPSLPKPAAPQRRRSSLARASQGLLHKLVQHQQLEQDSMARLASGDQPLDAGVGPPLLGRTATDAAHLAAVLQNGSELMVRAEQASSAWQSMQEKQHRQRSSLRGIGLLPIAEGASLLLGRASAEKPTSLQRVQRKSLLSTSSSATSLGSTATGGGGGDRGGGTGARTGRTAECRWEEEQEAEQLVLRVGALGDPEIQAYLIKELARSRRKVARRATTGSWATGRGGGEGAEGEEDDGRLDPIVQAWLVTKVPAPRVAGYTPPPSRTACRLIAAQEMQTYYERQKQRSGSFFKLLGLTQEQAGMREATGKFVVRVATEDKAPEAAKGKGLKTLVRKSMVSEMVTTMVKNTQANNWARDHVELVATVAAREMARQRAVRNWHEAFAEVTAAIAARSTCELPADAAAGSEAPGDGQFAECDVQPQEGAGAAGKGAAAAQAGGMQAGAEDAKQQRSREQPGSMNIRRTRASSPGNFQRLPELGSRAEGLRCASVACLSVQGGGFGSTKSNGSCRTGGLGEGKPSPQASLADRGGDDSSSLGDQASAAVDSRLASRLSRAQGSGGLGAMVRPAGGRNGPMISALSDFGSVAKAALEQHKEVKRARPRLSKLPPLQLEKLERTWQQAVRQQNTERERQEQKAKEQLLERWQQLQQRRAAMQD